MEKLTKKQKQDLINEAGLIEEGQLNQVVEIRSMRTNGTLRIQHDYQYCPTLTEQHSSHTTDLNYLIEKFKPDELAAYMAAKAQNRREILGHDFSTEPNLQEARNITYQLKKFFEELPDSTKKLFKDHVEFLKFIDNPQNQEKMLKTGLLTQKQIKQTQTIQQKTSPQTKPIEDPKNDKQNDDKTGPRIKTTKQTENTQS